MDENKYAVGTLLNNYFARAINCRGCGLIDVKTAKYTHARENIKNLL